MKVILLGEGEHQKSVRGISSSLISIIITMIVIMINRTVIYRNMKAVFGTIFVCDTTYVIITRNIISVSNIVAR